MIDEHKSGATDHRSRDLLYLAILASSISLAGFFFYFHQNALLLYGDAVAHINVARRVFDSRDPGPLQLGTVWLPLPHILILPFVIGRWMWRTGVGGAIPSMLAYVGGALGIFRLLRRALDFPSATGQARAAAWLGALVYAANPNLIYLQTTAMTEPLYLALFIWATVFFSEFVQQARKGHAFPARSLRNCGILLLLSMLTRYDGWFAGAVFGFAAVATYARGSLRADEKADRALGFGRLPLPWTRHALRTFLLLLIAVPLLWLVYNALAWGSPLAFATGPYSAKAIEQRTATPGMPHHPGYHSVAVAALYFEKAVKLNLGAAAWETAWVVLAVAGTALVLLYARRLWPLLVLWIPLPFYALAISRGGVPVFFSEWWPHGYYNVRYGLQLLPAAAVVAGVIAFFATKGVRSHKWRIAFALSLAAFVAGSYGSIWRAPLCLREARANSLARLIFEQKLGRELQRLPASATILMLIGGHGGALQAADIPLQRTINETTHPYWEQALLNPTVAEYAVAIDNDQVATLVHAHAAEFVPVAVVNTPAIQATIFHRR